MAPPGPRIWRRGEVKPLKEEVLDKLWNKKSMTKKTGRDSTVCGCESLCHVPLASYLPPLCTALIRRLLLMTPSHRRAMPPPPAPLPSPPRPVGDVSCYSHRPAKLRAVWRQSSQSRICCEFIPLELLTFTRKVNHKVKIELFATSHRLFSANS